MNDERTLMDEFFHKLSLNIANAEILGSSLLIYGYCEFIAAANQDKSITYDEMNGIQSSADPTLTLISGEENITLGLIILTFVASKRLYSLKLKGSQSNLEPYIELVDAYVISSIANIKRLEALNKIAEINASKESFV
ncbi:MAG: hypothetical protein ACRCVJ_02695 [Clostridium sp.]|uniref:hypothetical protein n=1 Tax=Clostridium sp. TaxID=1506 RepID=UPI003F3E9A2D